MSISIDSSYNSLISQLQTENAKTKADSSVALEGRLKNTNLQNASDEELMDVCKSFEAFLVEQVMKKTKESLTDSEEEQSPYLQMFGDNLYQAYSEQIAESGELGLAQQLFEAMKRDYGTGATGVKND